MAKEHNPYVYPMKWPIEAYSELELVGDQPGITLRDHVASQVLAAMVAADTSLTYKSAVEAAFDYAEYYLAERAKR